MFQRDGERVVLALGIGSIFLYGAAYKNLCRFHAGWCNHKQWKQLWFLALLFLEVWIYCHSLAGGKIWRVYMRTVLGIVGLKALNLAQKPVSDEYFCPRTVAPRSELSESPPLEISVYNAADKQPRNIILYPCEDSWTIVIPIHLLHR